MSPKEKVLELVDKYNNQLQKDMACIVYVENAKQCALICIEEIISQWEYIDTYLADLRGELNPNLKYWYEVKKELFKL